MVERQQSTDAIESESTGSDVALILASGSGGGIGIPTT